MNGLPPAAERLRGLDARDRAWLLARLAPAERARVEALLDELAQGAPTPGNAEAAAPGANGAADPRSEDVRELDAADPLRLAALLAREPDGVVAALLLAERWSWRERFLAALPLHRRRAVAEASVGALPPALREAVVAATAQQLRETRLDAVPDLAGEVVSVSRPARRGLARWLRTRATWPG